MNVLLWAPLPALDLLLGIGIIALGSSFGTVASSFRSSGFVNPADSSSTAGGSFCICHVGDLFDIKLLELASIIRGQSLLVLGNLALVVPGLAGWWLLPSTMLVLLLNEGLRFVLLDKTPLKLVALTVWKERGSIERVY